MVALAFVLLLTIFRLIAGGYVPLLIFTVIVLLGALMWANAILINRGHRISGTLLSLLVVPTIALSVIKGSSLSSHTFVKWKYKAEGLELVHGCNALAANMASFDVSILRERLAKLKDSPNTDSNQIVRVENAYATAQDKARILSDDCKRRGHRENHPWKSNWDTIKQVSAASRQVDQ